MRRTPRAGPGPHRRAERVDQQLAERLNQGDGSDRERVIITLKPGAKRRLLQELQAYGERADQDFGVIDAFAGRLPRRMLRQLRQHPDVVALSVDADVSPMSVAGVSGTAASSAYTLRRTLGLDSSIDVGTSTTATPGLKLSSRVLVAHRLGRQQSPAARLGGHL